MTIRLVPSILLLLAVSLLACKSESHEGQVFVELKTIQNPAGWGYEIYVDKKLYIKQDYIPVITGVHAFATKDDALKTGKVVMNKLEHGQVPTLTLAELKSLNVVQ